MTDCEYIRYLRELNEREQYHFDRWRIGTQYIEADRAPVKMTYRPAGSVSDQFTVFNTEANGIHSWFHAQKHDRYTKCPLHSHNYIEIAYMLQGQCTHTLEKKELTLSEGDLLFLSPSATHQVEIFKHDSLMINLMLFPNKAEKVLSSSIQGCALLDSFFIEAVYQHTSRRNYLQICKDEDTLPQALLLRLLRKYHENPAQDLVFEQLLSCFFALLAQKLNTNPSCVSFNFTPDSSSAQLIKYIEENCITCTLHELALVFGYNESWLSTKIKRYAGKSFVQLRNEFRLLLVEKQLNSTTRSVKSIAEQYGFVDSTQFYKLYRAYFGHRPREAPKNITL